MGHYCSLGTTTSGSGGWGEEWREQIMEQPGVFGIGFSKAKSKIQSAFLKTSSPL